MSVKPELGVPYRPKSERARLLDPPPSVVIAGRGATPFVVVPPSSAEIAAFASRPPPPGPIPAREIEAFSPSHPPPAPVPAQIFLVPPSSPLEREHERECPRCAEWIKARAKVCRFCGYDLEEERRPSSSSRIRRADRERIHVHNYAPQGPTHSPGVAAVLAFFWTGLGHIYCGEIALGIVLMIGAPAFSILVGFVAGSSARDPSAAFGAALVVHAAIWIGQMVHAYNLAERSGQAQGPLQPSKRRWRWRD